MIDVVAIFSDAADDAGYEFAYGRKDILNFETKAINLSTGNLVIFVFPFVETAQIDNSIIHKWSVSTQLWLGKKFDIDIGSGTYSNLDETELQKYQRRLKDLRDNLNTFIKSVFCNEDLELTYARVFRELNQTDENIDFVTAEIVFTYDD